MIHLVQYAALNAALTSTQTGDEGTLSPDGYITITGRIKDLIIRGGENIHPLEIENCLLEYPGVLDVSVVGVPDERYGEAVAAFVIPREDAAAAAAKDKEKQQQKQELQDWVREKLSSHLGEFSYYLDILRCWAPLAL